jgi:hypothetical protein
MTVRTSRLERLDHSSYSWCGATLVKDSGSKIRERLLGHLCWIHICLGERLMIYAGLYVGWGNKGDTTNEGSVEMVRMDHLHFNLVYRQ